MQRRNLPASQSELRPLAEEWDWQMRGLCNAEQNQDLFFGRHRERSHAKQARETRAKGICEQCPVLDECRIFALEKNQDDGVWGGLTEKERRALKKGK